MAAQTAVQARAGNRGVDELMGYRQQVIERQQQRLAQLDHHRLLDWGEGGVKPLEAVRSIFRPLTATPFRHRVVVEVVSPC